MSSLSVLVLPYAREKNLSGGGYKNSGTGLDGEDNHLMGGPSIPPCWTALQPLPEAGLQGVRIQIMFIDSFINSCFCISYEKNNKKKGKNGN